MQSLWRGGTYVTLNIIKRVFFSDQTGLLPNNWLEWPLCMITSNEQIFVCEHNSFCFHALCVCILFNFKTRLVEIWSSNANVHKGHCTLNYGREGMYLGKLV